MNVAKQREEWRKILDGKKHPPSYEKWSEADEEKLKEASKQFSLRDTALGMHHESIARQFKSGVLPNMSREDRASLMEELDMMGEIDSPMETGVRIAPNLSVEIEGSASTAVGEEQLSDPSNNVTNTDGMTALM